MSINKSCKWRDFGASKDNFKQAFTRGNAKIKVNSDRNSVFVYGNNYKSLVGCGRDRGIGLKGSDSGVIEKDNCTATPEEDYKCVEDGSDPQNPILAGCELQPVDPKGLEIVLAEIPQRCTKTSDDPAVWGCKPAKEGPASVTILKECKDLNPGELPKEDEVGLTCTTLTSCKFAVTSELPMPSQSTPMPSQSTPMRSQSTPVDTMTSSPTSTSTESGATDTSGLNAAIGVIATFLVVVLFVILFLLWRRRKDKGEPTSPKLLAGSN